MIDGIDYFQKRDPIKKKKIGEDWNDLKKKREGGSKSKKKNLEDKSTTGSAKKKKS
ncbi:MAG: hypothetical protein ACE5EK_07315 [Nitrospinales bacterium]